MRRRQMAIERLIDGFIAAHKLAVQGHERIARPQLAGRCRGTVTPDEHVIGSAPNRLAGIENNLQKRITTNEARRLQSRYENPAELANAIAPEILALFRP